MVWLGNVGCNGAICNSLSTIRIYLLRTIMFLLMICQAIFLEHLLLRSNPIRQALPLLYPQNYAVESKWCWLSPLATPYSRPVSASALLKTRAFLFSGLVWSLTCRVDEHGQDQSLVTMARYLHCLLDRMEFYPLRNSEMSSVYSPG